jgi:hypothetical protein
MPTAAEKLEKLRICPGSASFVTVIAVFSAARFDAFRGHVRET